MRTLLVLVTLAFWSFAAAAGTPAELRDYFEGREVVALIDMPGDKRGVDIRLDEARPVDFSEVGKRLKQYGISIRRGDRVTVTLVKVNKKNIEFQLNGGGFGTMGDPTTSTSINTNVPKSDREKRLEKLIKEETDKRRRERLEDELDDLRHRREREEARLEAEAEQVRILAEARERGLRLESGSRFNLWFERGVPPEALTPDAVMASLAGFVEFPDDSSARPDSKQAFVLRKGLTEQEVDEVYGQPVTRETERISDLTVARSVYSAQDGELQAIFVEGVLVKYAMVSK